MNFQSILSCPQRTHKYPNGTRKALPLQGCLENVGIKVHLGQLYVMYELQRIVLLKSNTKISLPAKATCVPRSFELPFALSHCYTEWRSTPETLRECGRFLGHMTNFPIFRNPVLPPEFPPAVMLPICGPFHHFSQCGFEFTQITSLWVFSGLPSSLFKCVVQR